MIVPPVVGDRGSRSGTIGRATGRATCATSRSVVRLLATCPDLSQHFVTDGTTNRTIGRRCDDRLCHLSPDTTMYRTIGRRTP